MAYSRLWVEVAVDDDMPEEEKYLSFLLIQIKNNLQGLEARRPPVAQRRSIAMEVSEL